MEEIEKRATKYLARRGYFKAELRKKLLSEKISEEKVENLVKKGEKRGWFDDEQRLENLIEEKFQKGWGPGKILAHLQEKGIEERKVLRAIESLLPEEKQKKKIEELLIKAASPLQKQKLLQRLKNRGFSPSLLEKFL